ncbi:unnamed protein product, partial [Brenthis ino]
MEKEHQPDSMATITMKPEYPPSEVYSASEPPPAYRQRMSSSVQIARIAALTVVAASFILGSFILASSWVSARASCHQLEQLDAMLDKELALEGRPYGNDGLMPDEPLPIANAHALHASPSLLAETASVPAKSKPEPSPDSLLKEDPLNHAESKVDEDKLQKIDDEKAEAPNSGSDESSESDSSGEEDDDELMPKFTMPIRFDLDELAGAFLANNQKGRMNCVVERRHEEAMEKRFPFNIISALTPRGPQTERISIICHGGEERPLPMFVEPQSQVFAYPLSGPVRLPLRPAPERPEPQGPFRMFKSLEQSPMPQRQWESSDEQMNPPREMRIHVQRIFGIPAPQNMPPHLENMGQFAPPPPPPQPQEQNEREQEEMMAPRQMRVIAIPAPHNMPPPPENMGPFQPPPPPQAQEENEQPAVLHQFVPQSAPTQEMEQPEVQKMQMEGSPVQMNLPWDLTPEDLHMIHRTAQEAVANQRREQQMDNDMQEVKTIVNSLAAAEAEAERAPRAPRTLLLPQDAPVDQRPHYMQPRSVRSVDSQLTQKRVKRCACSCA